MKILLNKSIDQSSPSRDYFLLAIITTFAMAIAMAVFIYFSATQFNRNNHQILQKEAENIDSIIFNSFEYNNRVNSYIGRQIANHGANDLKFIMNLFNEIDKMYLFREYDKTQNKNSELLSWTSFDWVNTNNLQTVNSKLGIRKDPPNMSARQYTSNAPKNPWQLQVSFPTLGNPSQMWVIPAGTGVVDDKNKFLGIVVVGFSVAEFESKIQQKLGNNNVNFVVLDNDSNIVLQSSGSGLKPNDDFYKKNKYAQKFNQKSNALENPIFVNGIKYSYYQKMDQYPYVILTGFHQTFLAKEFNNLILPRILEFIAITAFFLLILYLFKTRASVLLKIEESLKHQLHSSNQKLQALTKSVNHDLRNYISGIIGLAETIAEDKDPGQENIKAILKQDQEYAKMIANQAKIMLKFSKLLMTDEGIEHRSKNLGVRNFEEDFEDVDIAKLINDLIELKKPFIKEHEVSVKIDISEGFPTLKTNFIELRKILDNLITNAIKYSPKGSEVIVGANCIRPLTQSDVDDVKKGECNSSLQIQIIDNGIGMSEEDIEKALSGDGKLIDKSGLDKEIDSHGIGLPIVKQAVENLGARMEIESEKGKGTKVKLWFEHKDVGMKGDEGVENQQSQDLAKQTVLLTDDDQIVIMTTQRHLSGLGYNVLVARNGNEAITILDNHHCDLVLMDSNMKKIGDGFETIKLIREGSIFKNFKNFKTIPIISFSAHSDQESRETALTNGANGFLEKPFDKERFLGVIWKIVRKNKISFSPVVIPDLIRNPYDV